MRRIALLLEYDGTGFEGSQLQPGRRTVQGELEKGIQGLSRSAGRPAFAGRTDAGVHARGQVAAFGADFDYALSTVRDALNARLPADLAVRAAEEVVAAFDPRRCAVWRWYRYTILPVGTRSPLRRNDAWQLKGRLDVCAMQRAAAVLVGCHDFRAFAAKPSKAGAATVRQMLRAGVKTDGPAVLVDLVANAFLPHQVRISAAALVRMGLGRGTVDQVASLLEGGATASAGPVAPPQGLCLMRVHYEGLRFDVDEEEDPGDL